MKLRTIAAAVIATALSVNAFALSHKQGVVKSVDLEEKTISIATKNGSIKSYKLSDSAKVTGAESIKVGHIVTLKVSGEELKPQYVSATILSVNSEKGTAIVREKLSGQVRSVAFSENVSVRGRVDSVEELAEGQLVKVRYAAK